MFGLTGEVFVPSESFRFIRVDGLVISSPVSYPHHLPPLIHPVLTSPLTLYIPHHWCSTNCPYQRSCPLSPALSPKSNDLVRFFPGNMRYAESHISSSSLVRDMYFGFVRVSGSASLPIQSVPSPGLSYKTTT